ncbi:MAG: beta galactosidase jelly roll domain-containing protein [Marinifilaceae bacterium]
MEISCWYNRLLVKTVLATLYILWAAGIGSAQEYKKVVDLNQHWKFSIGDDPRWAASDYDDSGWESIQVPSAWENQGFYGYDGYAWYRTGFDKPHVLKGQSVYLQLGNVDDVDEVFINGKRIGKSGSFPPRYATAYNSYRLYYIPGEVLQQRNTIAVRVYDDGGEGGIINGDIALVIDRDAIPVDVDLQGTWKFKTGKYAHEDIEELKEWDEIIVPGYWENQGYKNYDGYACYALEFEVDEEVLADRMVLVMGKIDDLDQVYLNGVLVGQSGVFSPSRMNWNSYLQLRGYYLPVNLVRVGSINLLVVRVYDHVNGGGIYRGSVGLISQEHYIKYWNNRRRR